MHIQLWPGSYIKNCSVTFGKLRRLRYSTELLVLGGIQMPLLSWSAVCDRNEQRSLECNVEPQRSFLASSSWHVSWATYYVGVKVPEGVPRVGLSAILWNPSKEIWSSRGCHNEEGFMVVNGRKLDLYTGDCLGDFDHTSMLRRLYNHPFVIYCDFRRPFTTGGRRHLFPTPAASRPGFAHSEDDCTPSVCRVHTHVFLHMVQLVGE